MRIVNLLNELFVHGQSFLRDLLAEAQRDKEVTEDKLIEYTDTMV